MLVPTLYVDGCSWSQAPAFWLILTRLIHGLSPPTRNQNGTCLTMRSSTTMSQRCRYNLNMQLDIWRVAFTLSRTSASKSRTKQPTSWQHIGLWLILGSTILPCDARSKNNKLITSTLNGRTHSSLRVCPHHLTVILAPPCHHKLMPPQLIFKQEKSIMKISKHNCSNPRLIMHGKQHDCMLSDMELITSVWIDRLLFSSFYHDAEHTVSRICSS